MKKKLLFLITLFSFYLSNSQIQTSYYPFGIKEKKIKNNLKEVNKTTLPFFDLSLLKKEDKIRDVNMSKPYRFGKSFVLNISPLKKDWKKTEGGFIWSMNFYSKGAMSLNFVIEKLKLSQTAELYLVNKNKTLLYGPVTYKSNNDNIFLTDIIPGEEISFLIYDTNKSNYLKNNFIIKKVIHGYRNYLNTNGSPGSSLPCNNDVNCYSNWNLESDAVALILLSNGNELCTGSLLMTADQSFRPYLLTAFHCIDSNSDGSLSNTEKNVSENWMFKFQFKRTQCNGGVVNWGVNYNSATFRSGWNNTDFALMELNNSPIGNDKIAFLGWDKNGTNPSSGATIHHPKGDVMKISFDNNSLISNASQINWFGGQVSQPNTHWVVGLDNGTAEGGSSGSPIFNQSKRVVGQLHGGQSGCAPITKYYGQFHKSWNGGGTSTSRLSDWLDPCETGTSKTDTERSPYISGADTPCSNGTTYTVNGIPSSSSIVWTSSSNLTRTSSQGANPATFALTGLGSSGYINATITNGCGNSFSLRKNLTLAGNVNLTIDYVEPEGGAIYVSADVSGGSAPFRWYINNQLIATTYYRSFSHRYRCQGGSSSIGVISSCGGSNRKFYYENCGGNSHKMVVFPNPTKTEFTIELDSHTNRNNPKSTTSSYKLGENTNIKEDYIIYLLDVYGNVVKVKKYLSNSKKNLKFSVNGIQKGIYFMKIISKSTNEVHQVKIEN